MSRILVYSHTALWPKQHMVTLDLALSHATPTDHVTLLSCRGALVSCPANPEHVEPLCRKCVQQTIYSLEHVVPQEIDCIWLPDRTSADTEGVPLAFATLDEAFDFSIDGVNLGRYVVNSFVTESRDLYHNLNQAEQARIRVLAENAAFLFRQGRRILLEREIEHVLVRNPRRDSDGPLVAAARSLGVRSSAFDARGSGKTVRVAFQPGAERLFAADTWREQILELPIPDPDSEDPIATIGREFIERNAAGERIPDSTIPVFKTEGAWGRPESDPRKRLMAVFPSSEWEFVGNPEDIVNRHHVSQYDFIKRIVCDRELLDEFHIVVRWHPNLETAGPNERRIIEELIATSPPSVINIPPGDPADSRRIIAESDLVVTFGSTIAIDAVWARRPVIQCRRSWFDAAGVAVIAETFEEFLSLARSELPVPPRGAALRLAYLLREPHFGPPKKFEVVSGQWVRKGDLRPLKRPDGGGSDLSARIRVIRAWMRIRDWIRGRVEADRR